MFGTKTDSDNPGRSQCGLRRKVSGAEIFGAAGGEILRAVRVRAKVPLWRDESYRRENHGRNPHVFPKPELRCPLAPAKSPASFPPGCRRPRNSAFEFGSSGFTIAHLQTFSFAYDVPPKQFPRFTEMIFVGPVHQWAFDSIAYLTKELFPILSHS